MVKTARSLREFIKKETVLFIALLLAVISTAAVFPSTGFVDYIDWDTMAQLFSLVAVMKGFQSAGLFGYLGDRLLSLANTTRKMTPVLVFLPFFFSMVITNDVSLITFVPFAVTVLDMAGQRRLLTPVVIMQTLAANLGSMLTPMGNPQNLYLYAKSGMSFGEMCLLMLPYVAASGIILGICALFIKPAPAARASVPAKLGSVRRLALCTAGFILCLLGLFKVLPPLGIAAAVLVFLLISDRKLLLKVDYPLLGTFLALFIFIGNMSGIGWFRNFLSSIITGRVELAAVLSSQVISNVPAALLLSGFTSSWRELIVGCNLGGLGTLIASMASLISYKQVSNECPGERRRYFLWFTAANIAMLAALIAVGFIHL